MVQSNVNSVNGTVNSNNGSDRKKTVCPVTRQQFRELAKAIEVVLNGQPQVAEVKEFSTGSIGWYLNGKVSHGCKTRAEFLASAKAIPVVVNGIPMVADAKEFSTGSIGWNLNGKTTVDIGGIKCPVQIGLNMTVVGSKELPETLDSRVQVGMNLTLVGSKELPQ